MSLELPSFDTLMPSERLMAAVSTGDDEGVREALAAGANPNFNRSGSPMLLIAAGVGNVDVVKALMEAGADPNTGNRQDWLPIHEAARRGHADIIRHMGKNPMVILDLPVAGELPIHHAAREGHAEALSALLAVGARIESATADGKKTPLMLAVDGHHKDAVKVLIDAGALPDQPDADGKTARERARTWPSGLEIMSSVAKQDLAAPSVMKVGPDILEADPVQKEEEEAKSVLGIASVRKRGPR